MIIIFPDGSGTDVDGSRIVEWSAKDFDTGLTIANGYDSSIHLLGFLTQVLKYKVECIKFWVKTEKECA